MPSTRSGTRVRGWTPAIAVAACLLSLILAAASASAQPRPHATSGQTLQAARQARATARRGVLKARHALRRCMRTHRAKRCAQQRRALKHARTRLVRAQHRVSALSQQYMKPVPVSKQSDPPAAQPSAEVLGFEAESMAIPTKSDTHAFSDSLASAGKALSFPANGTVTKTITSGSASLLTVRARGDQCKGAPNMVVQVDGKTAMSVGVSATSWSNYSAAFALAAGSHKFSIAYNNDYLVKGVCDRNLRVDRMSLQSGTTTSGVSTTGTTTGTTGTGTTGTGTTGTTGTGTTGTGTTGSTGTTGTGTTGSTGSTGTGTTPTPTPTPTPSPSSMVVGLNGASYGTTGVNDVKNAVGYTRLDSSLSSTTFAGYESAGVKVEVDFSGPYTSSGISALDPTTWASNAVNWYGSNCTTDKCPFIEVLNEPWWPKWWGTNASSQTNADAYARLLQATWNAFHSRYGTSAPKILASCENQSWNNYWCNEWRGSTAVSNPMQYVDGVTVHPYGGTSDRTQSALGSRTEVATAYSASGKPVYVTEIGWPTATQCSSTGDSFQWSETDQATNITGFLDWARSTGYVAAVMYFNYHDFGSCDWYGVVRSDGTKKPGYYALQAEAAK